MPPRIMRSTLSAARRELIIANRDQQTLDEANAKVREAEEQRVALDDALRALDQKIAETTTRLEEAKDKAERDRIAQVLEQEADAVEKASLAVDKAAKQFALACRQLRSALSPSSCLRTPDRKRVAEDRVVGLLAAEALAGAAPNLFVHEPGELGVASVLYRAFPLGDDVVRYVTRDQQQLDNPSGAQTHAERLIMTRLRTKAGAIRSGQEPAVLPSAPPEPARHVDRVPLSATSCSCSPCATPADSVSPSSTPLGRLVCRRRSPRPRSSKDLPWMRILTRRERR